MPICRSALVARTTTTPQRLQRRNAHFRTRSDDCSRCTGAGVDTTHRIDIGLDRYRSRGSYYRVSQLSWSGADLEHSRAAAWCLSGSRATREVNGHWEPLRVDIQFHTARIECRPSCRTDLGRCRMHREVTRSFWDVPLRSAPVFALSAASSEPPCRSRSVGGRYCWSARPKQLQSVASADWNRLTAPQATRVRVHYRCYRYGHCYRYHRPYFSYYRPHYGYYRPYYGGYYRPKAQANRGRGDQQPSFWKNTKGCNGWIWERACPRLSCAPTCESTQRRSDPRDKYFSVRVDPYWCKCPLRQNRHRRPFGTVRQRFEARDVLGACDPNPEGPNRSAMSSERSTCARRWGLNAEVENCSCARACCASVGARFAWWHAVRPGVLP